MKRLAFAAALLALAGSQPAHRPALPEPNQVANYYAGQPGTASYEHFSFWSHEGRRYNMQYSHGPKRTDVPAHYAGATRVGGQPGFRVRLDDGRTFTLVPSGTVLRVSVTAGAAPKTFAWEYEGPVNGVGTFCAVCAPDSAAAMQLLRRHYLE